MIGKKKAAEYREDVRKAVAKTKEDPIAWLENRIAGARRKGEGTDVLESLRRVLTTGKGKARRKRSTATKS